MLGLVSTGNIEVTSCLIPEKFDLSSKCPTHVTSMLPLPRRGNVPQALCHRPFPSMILPCYLILRKTLKNKNSCFYLLPLRPHGHNCDRDRLYADNNKTLKAKKSDYIHQIYAILAFRCIGFEVFCVYLQRSYEQNTY